MSEVRDVEEVKPSGGCRHGTLTFGSGDYYLFCHACGLRWVCCSATDDVASPTRANIGVAASLSGRKRYGSLADFPELPPEQGPDIPELL